MKKILIVEDVEMNRDLLVQLLEDDYELIQAVDGKQGLDMACEEKALEAGCNDYLPKPIDEEELWSKVAKYING